MDQKTLTQTLRENWHLVLLFLLAMGGMGVGLFKAFSGGENTAAAVQIFPSNPSTVISEEEMREILFSPDGPTPPSAVEEKQKIVNEQRERYDSNPNDPDAEILLHAMGNLYKQTGDAKNAAWAYQMFLERFPNSRDKTSVYVELAGCYELLGEKDNLSRLYQDMLGVFPPDSNEYKYAEASLKITHMNLKQRNPDVTPQPGPEGTFTVEKSADGTTHYVESASKPESPVPDATDSIPNPETNAAAPAAQPGS